MPQPQLCHVYDTTSLQLSFFCILFIFLAFNLSYCFFGTCSLSALGSPIQNPNVHWSSLSPTNRRTIHSHFWSIALYLIVYYWGFFLFLRILRWRFIMKEGKSVKSNGQQQHHHQNGHLSPFKFAKLLDPEASWDKVRTLISIYFFCLPAEKTLERERKERVKFWIFGADAAPVSTCYAHLRF